MSKIIPPTISIIIPVYNSAQYIYRCLRSIKVQENHDFEVIIINDGSTDNSGDICERFAQNDKRFFVYHKKNEGVSIARNYGLNKARGKWVAFVDSDDEISQSFLTIPPYLEDNDVIQKSHLRIDSNGNKIFYSVKNKTLVTHKEIGYYWVNKRTNALWDKLIKREIINNIRFIPKVEISEDFLFFTSALLNIKKYAFCDIGYYTYFIREHSAMGNFKDNRKNISITFNHLNIVRKLEVNDYMTHVGESLVYGYFILTLWRLRYELTLPEKQNLRNMITSIKFSYLDLLNWKTKAKLILIKLFFQYIQ